MLSFLKGGIMMRKRIVAIWIIIILLVAVFFPITLGFNKTISNIIRYDRNRYDFNQIETLSVPPHANFTYEANGKNVFFDASSSYDIDGDIISFDWIFGDGETGSGKYVNYTYCCFNTYNVKLVVTDNESLTDETNKTITIYNDPPLPPTDPEPENGSTEIDINTILCWTCEDPNGDPLTYDVYFEKDNPIPDILVSSNQSLPYYDPPEPLEYESHYYWRVVAWDYYEANANGPVWEFTTGTAPNNPPEKPSDPDPINGSFNLELFVDLYWICSDPDDDKLVYDVYLEANDQDPDILVSDDQESNTFFTEKLQYKTMYYWQIIAKDEHGASSPGPIWHFEIKPEKNEPPEIPSINGPAIGGINKFTTYTFVAEDPDDDEVYYEIDWGDGIVDPWDGPYTSNKVITNNHKWNYWGLYTIRGRAKDKYGEIGDWGELTVTMPRGKMDYIPIIYFLSILSYHFPIINIIFPRLIS